MKKSINTRFLTAMISVVIVLLIFVSLFISFSVRFFFINDFYDNMESVLNEKFIAQISSLSNSSVDFNINIGKAIDNQKNNLGINAGRTVAMLTCDASPIYGDVVLFTKPEILRNKNFSSACDGKTGNIKNYFGKSMTFACPIYYSGSLYAIIFVSDDMTNINNITSMVARATLAACVFGLLLSVFISFKISKSITKPVKELTSAARKLALESKDTPIIVKTDDEIGQLSQTFNVMSSRLCTTIKSLESEKTKLSAIFAGLVDGVLVFDENGILYHKNAASQDFLVIDDNNFHCVFPELTENFKSYIMSDTPVDIILHRKEKYLHLIFSSFTDNKNLICIIHDETQSQNYLNLQKQFVANASHELKTPLTVVKSSAQTILEDEEMPLEPKKEFLKIIVSETDRMTKIISEMLTLSKNDFGISLNKTVFDLNELINAILIKLKINAKEKNINFQFEKKDEINTVYADKEKIYEVLENIISNAIKYTVNNDNININIEKKGENIVINVTDHGEEIPKDFQDKIFERFFRCDKSRSRKQGGTGLGLSIAREIAIRHGGNVILKNNEKGNCTFSLLLPTK